MRLRAWDGANNEGPMTVVSQFMSDTVVTCRASDTLQHAAHLMWDRDVGCLPVVDDDGHLLGLLTDRDMCMAAYQRDAPLRNIPVRAAMTDRVYACGPDDDLTTVHHTMAAHRVRRIPVLEATGTIVGILSLDDLARAATTVPDVPMRDVIATMTMVAGTAPQLDPDC